MEFMLNLDIKPLPKQISYHDRILLIGSCFTEHIGNTLAELKFPVMQNPHGILFDPASVCKSLLRYIENKKYTQEDLFFLNDVWNSWEHHSRFSHPDAAKSLALMNDATQKAHEFLKSASWIIVTLGSSFSYRLTETGEGKTGEGVANCHRAPGQWFRKHMLAIDETITLLDTIYYKLRRFNPDLNIIFTVSPVRHIRDGVVENNRSKARLIEAVHHMVNKFEGQHYFPAYELVIDVLRDYRFYDIDMVHPNYAATSFVLEKFAETCIDAPSRQLMQEVKKISIARRHKAFHPTIPAHQQFLASHYEKVKGLMEKYPFLDFREEAAYFSGKL
ncbi:GSCFA domain-containing protein [Terrimonas sp. NA20]|uniref:GSCFA domain-containing protein n=1 Tax=Terrimonas ginsenosidimutans TaxID=2908004 RepID=A0ABS9KWA3_9BACT|nr:GSCFA domain-containing protein [Terrimonas ginsenosidimutans]MCG2616624.1 GSCFA domain-containing protein [Terrimonas ginsenosidimutans]